MNDETFSLRGLDLRLEDFFQGRLVGWGCFYDRFGKLRSQFEIQADAARDGPTVVLDETLRFDDGRRENRTWRITRRDDGAYEGTADGMVGTAEGTPVGNALHWTYQTALDLGRHSLTVRFDEWMVQETADLMTNRAEVSKFGLRIGEVVIVFQRAA